ncbi:MAG: signal peptidase I [Myxococcota bacterium]|nr:signal peptidase I [Myxococcota bacterium]
MAEAKGRSWPLWAAVGALVTSLALRRFVFGLVTIQTGSMQPNLRPQQTLLYSKTRAAEPGDVVVLELPWEPGVLHVKRLVAQGPGEVELADGRLYLSGEPVFVDRDVDVPWRSEDCRSELGRGHRERIGEEEWLVLGGGDHARTPLKAGEVWVLGDRRGRSEDSGQWGPIPASALRGTVITAVWDSGRCEGE